MRKSTVILILIVFLCQNIAWGEEFMLRPPLQGAKRADDVFKAISLTNREKQVPSKIPLADKKLWFMFCPLELLGI